MAAMANSAAAPMARGAFSPVTGLALVVSAAEEFPEADASVEAADDLLEPVESVEAVEESVEAADVSEEAAEESVGVAVDSVGAAEVSVGVAEVSVEAAEVSVGSGVPLSRLETVPATGASTESPTSIMLSNTKLVGRNSSMSSTSKSKLKIK